jgi:hypothetical protein
VERHLRFSCHNRFRNALKNQDIQPSRYYTAFGEADASFLLGKLLGPRERNMSLVKTSQLSWRRLADNNVLFLGEGRETDASDWQYSGNTAKYDDKVEGTVHTITVPISKDNVYFGIRSCDTKGHCSAAVAPAPEIPVRTGTPRQGGAR